MQRITSRQNPIVARYRAVARGDDADLLLLVGVHLVADALAAGIQLRQAVVSPEALGRAEVRDLVDRMTRNGVDLVSASATVMDAVNPVRSANPIVALAVRPTHEQGRWYSTPNALVVIGVGIQDPGNVGAVVRVAEAAGGLGAVFTGSSADPFGWKALRGSMGSALRLPVAVDADADHAIAVARRHGCRIIATVPRGGRSVFDVDFTGGTAIVVGGEGAGLPPALIDQADERITIPMEAPVESLNTAVTAAVIVYEARRQRHAQPKADS